MNVLFLGPPDSPILDYFAECGDSVAQTMIKFESLIDLQEYKFFGEDGCDFIVSFGYRHILPADVVKQFHKRAVNIHLSYLPFNRGADPNFWSWIDDTPKGVTIHYIDEGIDTGEIIAQAIWLPDDMKGITLRNSYAHLTDIAMRLFKRCWPVLKNGGFASGSFHSMADIEQHLHLFSDGWDTPVNEIKRS